MSPRSFTAQPSSPLDVFLARFLRCLERFPDGYSPIADAARVADDCNLVPAFAEALFVSARTRGLIEPFRSKGAKGRYRWHLSRRGAHWLASNDRGDPAPAVEPEPPHRAP